MTIKLDSETEYRLKKAAVYNGMTISRLMTLLIEEYVPIVEWNANGTSSTEPKRRTFHEMIAGEKQHKPLKGQTSFLD